MKKMLKVIEIEDRFDNIDFKLIQNSKLKTQNSKLKT